MLDAVSGLAIPFIANICPGVFLSSLNHSTRGLHMRHSQLGPSTILLKRRRVEFRSWAKWEHQRKITLRTIYIVYIAAAE